jgi:hypothetical protein
MLHGFWAVSPPIIRNSKLKTVHIASGMCRVLNFELLMMGGESARNTWSTDSNKEYCIALHLVGYPWKNTLTMHGPINVRFFSPLQNLQTTTGAHSGCYSMHAGGKVTLCEPAHAPPASTKVRNGGVNAPAPPTCHEACMGSRQLLVTVHF